MEIKAIGDKVVLRRLEAETHTPGGLIIPGTATEKRLEGVVVSVGAKVHAVKVGEKVLVGKYTGNEIRVDGVEYVILKEEEILGVLEG